MAIVATEPPAARGAGGTPTFGTELIASRQTTADPAIAYDATGPWTYVAAPGPSTRVWRKGPGSAWQVAPPTRGRGGEADVAVDGGGVVYAADLYGEGGEAPVSVSFDHAANWRFQTVVARSGSFDREWLAAWGDGRVVEVARDPANKTLLAWASSDHASSFAGPVVVAGGVVAAGRIARAPDGELYVPWVGRAGVWLAASADGGEHWVNNPVAATPVVNLYPSVAVDQAGTVYVAWSVAGARHDPSLPNGYASLQVGGIVQVAASSVHGAAWSTPVALSAAGHTAVLPWAVAGSPGHVGVIWYGANSVPGADTGPDVEVPATSWDIDVAESSDAAAPHPQWQTGTAVAGVHTGSICVERTSCLGSQTVGLLNAPTPWDRRMLDFAMATATPAGALIFAYGADRKATSGELGDIAYSALDVREATQTGGPLLR